MDLIDRLKQLAIKVEKQSNSIETEEATKTAFVMPFISALGYDVFDPSEVKPEYTADAGNKKGEKVDYAILQEDKPLMLIECKKIGCVLNSLNEGQLLRYFTVKDARIGILTDGVIYKFYSDLVESKVMDEKPFFVFNLSDFNESDVAELKKFSKSGFEIERILNTATEMKYSKEIIEILNEQFDSPCEEFVKFFGYKVHTGMLTKKTIEQLSTILKKALSQFINQKLDERLKSALSNQKKEEKAAEVIEDSSDNDGIVTTEEEIEGYHIVKSILRTVVDPSRVTPRDTKSYFGVLLDDSNRKIIVRLRFNAAQKYIGIFDAEKKEEKFPINDLNEIYKYSEQIIKTTESFFDE